MRNLWHRSLCMFLTAVMIFGMMPMNVFGADPAGRTSVHSGEGYAVYQQADGSFTLEVLDGIIKESELLAILGRASAGYKLNGGSRIEFSALGWPMGDGDNDVALSNDDTLQLQYSSNGWKDYATYTVKVYHNLTVYTTPATVGGVIYGGETYTNGQSVEVYTGDTVSAVESVGYGITGNSSMTVTATGDFAIVYEKKDTAQCAVNLEVVGGDYGSAGLSVGSEMVDSYVLLDEGTRVTVNAAPKGSNCELVSVTGVELDSSNQFTVNGDVTVTVTFAGLTGAASADVRVNGYEADNGIQVAQQMNGGTRYADVANGHCLEQAIFEALNVGFSSGEINWDTDGVAYGYYPWIDYDAGAGITDGYADEAIGLDAVKEDAGNADYKNFGERGFGETEKVRISYNGLYIDAIITLVDGRLEVPGGDTASSGGTADAIKAAAAAAVTFAFIDADSFALEDGWEDKLDAAQTGAQITATAAFAGNAAYKCGNVSVLVTVAKVITPASITLTNGTGGGVVITGSNGKTVGANAYEETGPLTVTATPNAGYYVSRITVNGEPQTIRYDAARGSVQLNIENAKAYSVAVEYAASVSAKAAEASVPMNGFYSPAEQEETLKAAIYNALVDADNSVHDAAAYTVQVYDSGYFKRWCELSIYTDLAASWGTAISPGTAVRQVRILWDATNTHPACELYASVVFEESRVAPAVNQTTMSLTADSDIANSTVEGWFAVTTGDGKTTIPADYVTVSDVKLPGEGVTAEDVAVTVSVDASAYSLSFSGSFCVDITNPDYDVAISVRNPAGAAIEVAPAVQGGYTNEGGDYVVTVTPDRGNACYVDSVTVNGTPYTNGAWVSGVYEVTVNLDRGAFAESASYEISAATGVRSITVNETIGEVTFDAKTMTATDTEFLKRIFEAAVTGSNPSGITFDDCTVVLKGGAIAYGQNNIFEIIWEETEQYPAVSAEVEVPVAESRSSVVISGTASIEQINLETMPTLESLKASVEAAISGLSVPDDAAALTCTADEADLRRVLDTIKQGDTINVTVAVASAENDHYLENTAAVEVPVYGVIKNTDVTVNITGNGTVTIGDAAYTAGTYSMTAGDYAFAAEPDCGNGWYWRSVSGVSADMTDGDVNFDAALTVATSMGEELGTVLHQTVTVVMEQRIVSVNTENIVIEIDGGRDHSDQRQSVYDQLLAALNPAVSTAFDTETIQSFTVSYWNGGVAGLDAQYVEILDAGGNAAEKERLDLAINTAFTGGSEKILVCYAQAGKYPAASAEVTVTVEEYGVLDMNATSEAVILNMYQAGDGYEAEIPSAEEIFKAVIGDCSHDFLERYENMSVEFSADRNGDSWKAVSDENLLALADGTAITVRITWMDETQNTYDPVSVTKDVTLADQRTPTVLAASHCEVSYGYTLDQLLAASGAAVTADGTAVPAVAIKTDDLYLQSSGEAQKVTLYFAGTSGYQPCETTIDVIVKKAVQDDTDDREGFYPVAFDPDKDTTGTIVPGGTVEIDGIPYVLDENCMIWVPHAVGKLATTYKYHIGDTQYQTYPTEMYVWHLAIADSSGDDGRYTAERAGELDGFFRYEGTSIRVDFSSNGIRFFTSVPADACGALIDGDLLTGSLSGYKLVQAGTLYAKWSGADSCLTLDTGLSSDVYGGKAGGALRIFSKVDDRNWYTGVLTGLDKDAETFGMDILSRPFVILERNGEQIVLYGGTVQRSIYYVAAQNRNHWASGTAYDNFIENIIATVESTGGAT